jgi:hypothetical protein
MTLQFELLKIEGDIINGHYKNRSTEFIRDMFYASLNIKGQETKNH